MSKTMGYLEELWLTARKADCESENRIWKLCVLWILDSANWTANSSAVKMLVVWGDLAENASLELRKTEAAQTWLVLLEPSVKFLDNMDIV